MKSTQSLFAALALLICGATGAQASITAALGTNQIDPSAPTHVFVIGYSHGMGNQFYEVALARALRYRELFPSRQIVIFRNRETGGKEDLRETEIAGVRIVSEDANRLTGERLIAKLRQFTRIASLEISSHSSTHIGVGLEGSDPVDRLYPGTPGIEKLRGHFDRDAYVYLHGCNGGYVFGPYLSKLWGVPAAAALTSTDFQQLHADGKWYFNNPGQYPATGGWKKSNDVSYENALSCADGKCRRLKPDNHPYNGMWGEFEGGGLPFYKFFCNFEGGESACPKAMALSILGFPSVQPVSARSTEREFSAVLDDFFCPTDAKGAQRADCVASIEKKLATGDEVYSPFKGNTLECGLTGCNVEVKCKTGSDGLPVAGTCVTRAPENKKPKTLLQEYKRYLEGFRQLSQ
jgi:hypothetical protein